MPLPLGQLIYTSFTKAGLKTLVSPSVPADIQQEFLQAVVHQYWNAYRPPHPEFQGAYLYQVAADQTLFGWVFEDGVDDLGRSHFPYFLCYYLEGLLEAAELDAICHCLEQGPLVFYDRRQSPIKLGPLSLPALGEGYNSDHPGVSISQELRDRSHRDLQQGQSLDWFVLGEERQGDSPSEGPDLPIVAPQSQPSAAAAARVALLIGVSDCAAGFTALPGVQKDVRAMQAVLGKPNIGNFTAVNTLINPDRQQMAEAIEELLAERQPEDLIFLYFSGHAVQDDHGNIYWSTGISRKNSQGQLGRSTLIAASFVQDLMNNCPSQQQVVILDCAWNDDKTPTPNSWLNLKQQLGGRERLILTASTTAHTFLNQKGADLSAYTFYLWEGLKTGVADANNDGMVSLAEWHEYAHRKVQAATPALQPQLYGHLSSPDQVAKAPLADPPLQYRKGVESCLSQGKITLVNRTVLDALQASLGLSAEEAMTIETAVLKPHQTYQQKLQIYAQCFLESIQQDLPGSPDSHERFQSLRQRLGLTDANTGPLELQLIRQLKAVQPSLAAASPQPPPRWSPFPPRWPASNGQQAMANQQQLSLILDPLLLNNLWTQAATTAQAVVPVLTQGLLKSGQLLRYPPALKAIPQVFSRTSLAKQRQSWGVVGIGAAVGLVLTVAILGVRQQQSRQTAQQIQAIAALADQGNYESCLGQWQQMSQRSQSQARSQQLRQTCEAGLNWHHSRAQTLRGHQGAVWAVAVSPEGQTLASAGEDQQIRVWSINTGQLLRSLSGHTDTIWSIAISPDGKLLVSGSADQTIKIWNLQTGKLNRTLSGHGETVWAVAISPDGKLLVSGSADQTIKIWNLATGKQLRTLSGHQGPVRSLAISPDGNLLASGSTDKTIKLWNLQTGKLQRSLSGHWSRVITLATSPDGKLLASGSGDQTLNLWDLTTGKLLRTLSGNSTAVTGVALAVTSSGPSLAMAPLVAGGSGTTVQLWNGATGEVLQTFSQNSSQITTVAFSPDGLKLIYADQDRRITVRQR